MRVGHRNVDVISNALPFGRLWYEQAPDAIGYAEFRSRSHDAVIRVYDEAGNVIATHEQVRLWYDEPNAITNAIGYAKR